MTKTRTLVTTAIFAALLPMGTARADSPSASSLSSPPAAPSAGVVVIRIDPVALIRDATVKYQGQFKLSERAAVSAMDGMLVQQYVARGRLSNEPDAALKALYYQVASLVLNGYPIAGGTVFSVARQAPAFRTSPAGAGMAAFVDAMLQGSDEDVDLLELQQRTVRARSLLRDLRGDLRFYADLWVVGELYRDDIAVDAGKRGVDGMKATTAERRIVRKALGVK